MTKKVPIKPTQQETAKSWRYTLVCIAAWIMLIFGVGHLIYYYIRLLLSVGFYDKESVKIGIYVIAGAFAFLFIYKDKAKEIFNVKDPKEIEAQNE